MKLHSAASEVLLRGLVLAVLVCAGTPRSEAQEKVYERRLPQPKAAIEKALKDLAASGRLPVLDGFAIPGDHPLDRYERGYYQSTVKVSSSASGGSIVRVSTKVTAWYTDSVPSRSGYQLLTSNGRLEADFLDQLAEHLAQSALASPGSSTPVAVKPTGEVQPTLSAPMPRFPEAGGGFSSSLSQSVPAGEVGSPTKKSLAEEDPGGLQAEANSLEEVLKNQAHPKNLVAVKKSGTPVVATRSLNAKTLFMASAHDEFEMLDFNADWVHVRISGLSRGWIWRNSLEMPDSVPDINTEAVPPSAPTAAELFRVVREETSLFPGDWAALRGKTVKIISVEKIDEGEKGADARMKLEFAKAVFDKGYEELAQKGQEMGGIVLIFDSADGGMMAAALPALQQWKAGTLSDSALWHQCFFDPPETFDFTASPARQ
ncbi:MAG: hypothetical protein WB562_01000 [Candidatus Sulfotelmatobacter sp.]